VDNKIIVDNKIMKRSNKTAAKALRQSVTYAFQSLRQQGFLTYMGKPAALAAVIQDAGCSCWSRKPYVLWDATEKKSLRKKGMMALSFGTLYAATEEEVEEAGFLVLACLRRHQLSVAWDGSAEHRIVVFADDVTTDTTRDSDEDNEICQRHLTCILAARYAVVAYALGLMEKMSHPLVWMECDDCSSVEPYWYACWDAASTEKGDLLQRLGLPDTPEGRETLAMLMLAGELCIGYSDDSLKVVDLLRDYENCQTLDTLHTKVRRIIEHYSESIGHLACEVDEEMRLSQAIVREVLDNYPPFTD
jgi:hypothetical protein